jgi:hypothetical protein
MNESYERVQWIYHFNIFVLHKYLTIDFVEERFHNIFTVLFHNIAVNVKVKNTFTRRLIYLEIVSTKIVEQRNDATKYFGAIE